MNVERIIKLGKLVHWKINNKVVLDEEMTDALEEARSIGWQEGNSVGYQQGLEDGKLAKE
mgnify:CR=1 FL=1